MIGAVPLQDLLPDEASRLIIGLLRLAMSPRAGRYWAECKEALAALRGIGPDDDSGQARLARELDPLALDLSKRHPAPPGNKAQGRAGRRGLGIYRPGPPVRRASCLRPGKLAGQSSGRTVLHLTASATGAADWSAALDAYEGVHAVPLLTIHKSKGLDRRASLWPSPVPSSGCSSPTAPNAAPGSLSTASTSCCSVAG